MRAPRPMLRLVILAFAAAGFATLAVVFAERHVARTIARQQAAARGAEPMTVAVVVAKFDLVAGETVGAENMAVRQIPADLAPGSALRPEQFDAKAGMRLTRPLRSGEPLLSETLQVADPGGLASRVRQGIRALTIAVDDVNAVSGMLRPGDRIDLLFSARANAPDSATAVESARVLIQDVSVLATGRQFRSPADDSATRGFTSITVALSPEDAKRLVVAQRTGRITALLRNPDDRHPVSTGALDAHALLGTRPASITQPSRRMGPSGPEMIVGGNGSISVARAYGAHDGRGLPEAAGLAPGLPEVASQSNLFPGTLDLARAAGSRPPSSPSRPAVAGPRSPAADQSATQASAPLAPPSLPLPTQPLLFR